MGEDFEWGNPGSVGPPNWSMAPPPAAPPLAAPPLAAPLPQAEPGRPAGKPRRGRTVRTVAIAAVSAGALALVGVSVASAQSSGTTTTTTPSTAAPSTTAPATPKPGPRGGPRGFFGAGALGKLGGFGAGGSIHGEFVRPDGKGGYQTVDTQIGIVQAGVSSSLIEVKSADLFDEKYSVTTNTVVNSGRDGIGSVKMGDTVVIEGVVATKGAMAEAGSIVDTTTLGNIKGRLRPQPPAAPAAPTTPSTTTP